jgi:hypothetical protein
LANSISLITLQDFDPINTWLRVVSRETNSLGVEVPVDVARAVSIFNPVTPGIVICLDGGLLEKTLVANLKLFLRVAVISAPVRKHIDYGRPCIELHAHLLHGGSEINLSCILLIIDVFQWNVSDGRLWLFMLWFIFDFFSSLLG